MSRLMALAGVAAVIAVAIGALAFYTPRPTGIVGASALPPPRATPPRLTPAPSQGISTAGWQPFTSTRYGYIIEFPAGWSATPASRVWSLDVDREAWDSPASDHFLGQSGGQTVLLTAFSVGVSNATALSDWVSAYLEPGTHSRCTVSTPAPITMRSNMKASMQ